MAILIGAIFAPRVDDPADRGSLVFMATENNIERRKSPFQELLALAASAAGETDLDSFMRAAWSAFVDARPGLRERLEELRFLAELESLREQGRLPEA